MWQNPRTQNAQRLGCLCLILGAEKELRVDKVKDPRPSISKVIWILSSDTNCQLNQLFSNSEAAMLSKCFFWFLVALSGLDEGGCFIYSMTRCQILGSMRLHCVSKTLTPCKMH